MRIIAPSQNILYTLMTSKTKLWSVRITMVIALAVASYVGGVAVHQVSASTETTIDKSSFCENDYCRSAWIFGVCRPGSDGEGCNMTWALGCETYACSDEPM